MTEADDEALQAAIPLFGPAEELPDDTPPKKTHLCGECGVELEYNGRGRPPVWCELHKPKKHQARTASPSGGGRKVTSRSEREARDLAKRLDNRLAQASLMVAPFDAFDGMTIYAMRGPVVEQFEGVMATHDAWRASLTGVEGTGSVAGLIVALLALAAPIAAHHGLIPATVRGYPIGEALVQIPKITLRLQKAAETGEEVMQEYLARMAKEEAERKAAKETPNTVNPTGPHEH